MMDFNRLTQSTGGKRLDTQKGVLQMKVQRPAIAFCTVLSLIILAPGLVLPAPPTAAQSSATYDVRLFYEKLTPYGGEWIRLDPHGWVWVPPALAPAWRPYTVGRWVYTELGMTWVSAWAWGWATFHYGRWAFNTQYGWVWVPGTVWAPAWVAWQVGNGWVGWAPLPPQANWDPNHGLSAERIDLIEIDALRYVFVVAPQVLAAQLHRHVVTAARNVTLLQQSHNTTAYTLTAGRVHNDSLSSTQVVQFVGHAVPHYRLSDIDIGSTDLRTQIEEKRVLMFQPLLRQFGPESETALPDPSSASVAVPIPATSALGQRSPRKALDARLADEYAQMQARHAVERKRAAQQEEEQEALRQQQERERQAFDTYAERERRTLDNQLKRKGGKVQFRFNYNDPTGQPPGSEQ